MKQLSLFDQVDERELRRRVIRELQHLRVLRVRLTNKMERLETGTEDLFPILRENEECEIRARQVERALQDGLDEDQRRIIEMKYLQNGKIKDITAQHELGMSHEYYYIKKKQAIYDIATALGII